jgi:hypothetical protein
MKIHSQGRGGFVEHPSLTYVVHQSVTEVIALLFINLVTPKAFVQQTGLRFLVSSQYKAVARKQNMLAYHKTNRN